MYTDLDFVRRKGITLSQPRSVHVEDIDENQEVEPPENSTSGSAVFRKDGIRLYGFDAEVERRVQEKRDVDWERKLISWVEEVLGEKVQHPDDVGKSFKTGVLLCRLINAIEPNTISKIDTRDIPLVHMENINKYLKACWKLGVPSADLFITSDLFQETGIQQVIQNIASLARLAQSKLNWKGPRLGPSPRRRPSKPVKRWPEVRTNVVYKTVSSKDANKEDLEKDKEETGKLQQQLAEQERLKQQLESEIQELENKLEKQIRENIAVTQREKQIQSEVNKLEEELAEWRQREEKTDFLMEQIKNLSSRLEKSEDAVKTLSQEKEDLEEENKRSRERTLDLENQSKEVGSVEIDSMSIEALVQQNERLQKEAEHQKNELEIQKAQMEKQKLSYEEKISQLNSDIAKITNDINELSQKRKEEVEEISLQLIMERQEKTQLQDELEEVKQLLAKEKETRREWQMKFRRVSVADPYEAFMRRGSIVEPRKSYEDETESEESQGDPLELLEESVIKLINSQYVEQVDRVKLLLLQELGRRHFAKSLRKAMKESTSFSLKDDSFEILVDLFNTTLHEMEVNEKKDFITAKKLLKSAVSIRKASDKKLSIKRFIKDHSVWREINFWREYFNDELFRKHRQYFPGEKKVDRDFVSTLVCSFALNMKEWGVSNDGVNEFISIILYSSEFELQDPNLLEVQIKNFLVPTEEPQETKSEPEGPTPNQRHRGTLSNSDLSKLVESARERKKSLSGIKSKPVINPSNMDSVDVVPEDKKKKSKPSSRIGVKPKSGLKIPVGQIIRAGYLTKKGGPSRGNWKLRFFVLKYGSLSYMKSIEVHFQNSFCNFIQSKKAKGVITLANVYVAPSDKKENCFLISDGIPNSRIYYMVANSLEERDEWMEAIRTCIEDPLRSPK